MKILVTCAHGTATGDIIFCATSFASLFKNAAAAGTTVIGMRNILSLEEIRQRLQDAGFAPADTP